jgi:hypothetical protein
MVLTTRPRRQHAGHRLTVACATLSISLAVGCASPGPPRPPSLRLPMIVKDLAAERAGDEVHLHWTTPAKTTDDLPIKGSLTAEICRDPAAPSQPTTPSRTCTVVARLAVQPGPSQATDTLPSLLTHDPAALLSYRVQILNTNGRTAGPSPETFVAAGAAPPPVEDLRATPVPTGAMLEWRQQPTTAPVELDRLLESAPPTPAKAARPKPSLKPTAKPTAKPSPTPGQPVPATPAEVRLQTPQQASDAGGTIDRTAQFGETYRYTAHRVRTLAISGHSLEIRSLSSAPITILLKDTFPPAPPTGLAAVPGGTTPADVSIDLSWEPDTDPDLAGYIVYRQQVNSTGALTGPATRLNATPLPGPAYRDLTAVIGQRYAYRVTAVDTVGNESAPSADVQEKLTEQ